MVRIAGPGVLPGMFTRGSTTSIVDRLRLDLERWAWTLTARPLITTLGAFDEALVPLDDDDAPRRSLATP